MKQRTLGKTGFAVSEIGLGCWQLGGDFGPMSDVEANTILKAARSADISFWDTADVYGGGQSESRIGSFADKRDVVVATKVGRGQKLWPDRYFRRLIKESLVESIKRLGVEQLDLVQLHCLPTEVIEDGEISVVMDDLADEGLMQNWGASVESVHEGLLCLRFEGCATLQIIFNLFRQDAVTELLPKAKAQDVGVIVRLPLASGLLSGKYRPGQTFSAQDHRNYNANGEKFFVGETFSGLPMEKGIALADQLKGLVPKGMTLPQLALRWILDRPEVSTVIAGVSKPEQVAANVAVMDMDPLDPELVAELFDFYERRVRPEVRGHI